MSDTLLSDVIRADSSFAAAIRAVEEADKLRARVKDLSRQLYNSRRNEQAAVEMRETWKQRCLDAEWACGMRDRRSR